MGDEELHHLIQGCIKQDRQCQKMLYKAFYGFSMSICLRYSRDRDEAAEIMNQGFFKIFTNIARFDPERPFKAWIGKIMTNTSIDHYRANLKLSYTDDLETAGHIGNDEISTSNLNYRDLLDMVQMLPRAYRTVFNLFAIDGYSHEEIGAMLNISPGTSKSNLHKARQKLKQMILDTDASSGKNSFKSGNDYTYVTAIDRTDFVSSIFNNGIWK